MFPYQPTWSNTRINLLQRCPRAFVLRYGLAQLSKHHAQGQMLSVAFQIQTPWVLLHQTIREVLLDYIEDYGIGNQWSKGLLRARVKADYTKAIQRRNQRIRTIQSQQMAQSFTVVEPEIHLIEMGVDACLKLLENPHFVTLLSEGSIERIEATTSVLQGKIRIYAAPDFIHYGRDRTSLVKFNLYGQATRCERERQAALLMMYGEHDSRVIQFSLKYRKWSVNTIASTQAQTKQTLNLVSQDVEQMEAIFAQVGKNNDLSLIPLADSLRSCMNCNVRSLCPSRHGYEHAKAEQRSLMCQ